MDGDISNVFDTLGVIGSSVCCGVDWSLMTSEIEALYNVTRLVVPDQL